VECKLFKSKWWLKEEWPLGHMVIKSGNNVEEIECYGYQKGKFKGFVGFIEVLGEVSQR